MEEILWEGFICDSHDILEYLRGVKDWNSVRKNRVIFLVDTGASRSIVLKEAIGELTIMDLGETEAQGICDKPSRFRAALIGVAIKLNGNVAASIHEVLIPLEKDAEEKIRKILRSIGATAILGRLSMDSLNLRIHPKTHKPIKIPTLLL